MSRFLSRGNLPRRRHRDTARLAQDLLLATRLSQSLPRWVGPPLVKTKIPTSLQLFFRLGTLSCSHKAKTGRFAADLLRFRADIPALPLRNNP